MLFGVPWVKLGYWKTFLVSFSRFFAYRRLLAECQLHPYSRQIYSPCLLAVFQAIELQQRSKQYNTSSQVDKRKCQISFLSNYETHFYSLNFQNTLYFNVMTTFIFYEFFSLLLGCLYGMCLCNSEYWGLHSAWVGEKSRKSTQELTLFSQCGIWALNLFIQAYNANAISQ